MGGFGSHRVASLALICAVVAPAEPVRAEPVPSGLIGDGLPGLHRARTAEAARPGLSAIGSLAYGFTESVLAESDQHHSAMNAVGVSYGIAPWLAVAGSMSSRFDIHRRRFDTTYAGVPTLAARAVVGEWSGWTAAAHVAAWFPTLSAVSFDALVAGSRRLAAGHRLTLNGGFRVDRSAGAIEDRRRMLEPTDLLTLGSSDSHALLLAAGWDWRARPWLDVFAEWSYDLHVGDRAPEIEESPMRFGAGGRVAVASEYRLIVGVETNISRVPVVDGRERLVPVEPIVALNVALTRRPPRPVPPAVVAPVVVPTTGRLEGVVVTQDDVAIPGAVVTAGGQRSATAADGSFALEELAPGPLVVEVDAPGHVVAPLRTEIVRGKTVRLPVVAVPETTPGQIRLVVRSLAGTGLRAKVSVQPGDHKLDTDDRGQAMVELAPGDYTVSVASPGHMEQQRSVTVDPWGVTILNMDLMTARPARGAP